MSHLRLIGLAVCLAATVVICSFQPEHPVHAEPAESQVEGGDANSNRPYGIDKRVPWMTSRFRGRPEPPLPYHAQRIFPKINFKNPTVLTGAPGTDRFFVAEQTGKIFSLPNDQSAAAPDLFLNTQVLADRLAAREKQAPSRMFSPPFCGLTSTTRRTARRTRFPPKIPLFRSKGRAGKSGRTGCAIPGR
jgi:hypothetical protein